MSPLQDFKHKNPTLLHPHSLTHTHTHLYPSFHQVILTKTAEPETSEFIQARLSCQEKPFHVTAVVLLKPFNQNQRASTYRGEDRHRKEVVESPAVSVPAAAEVRGTMGGSGGGLSFTRACPRAKAPARSGCSRPRLLYRTPRVGRERLFLPKPTCGCLPDSQGAGGWGWGLRPPPGRKRSRAGVRRLSVAPGEKPDTNTKSRQDKQIPLLRSCGGYPSLSGLS